MTNRFPDDVLALAEKLCVRLNDRLVGIAVRQHLKNLERAREYKRKRRKKKREATPPPPALLPPEPKLPKPKKKTAEKLKTERARLRRYKMIATRAQRRE